MLNLASVSDAVSVVTSAAGSIDVFASWMDNLSTLVTPGNTLTASITTATTTTVVGSPASSTQRVVRLLVIRNTHASTANDITIQITNGTLTKTLKKETLAAGEAIWVTDGRAVTYLASGAPKEPDTLNLSGIQTLSLGAVSLIASPVIGSLEYDGNNFYGTPVSAERAVIQQEAWITLQSGTRTLASQTAAQKMFASPTNGALTIAAGRMYEFECIFALASMSATSGSFGWALTGTATFTEIKWMSWAAKLATIATGTTPAALVSTYNTTAANTALVAANTAVAGFALIIGTFISNAGGTIIPSISLGIAATAVLSQGAIFKARALGNSAASAGSGWS
jgi:hypothetical protein